MEKDRMLGNFMYDPTTGSSTGISVEDPRCSYCGEVMVGANQDFGMKFKHLQSCQLNPNQGSTPKILGDVD